MPLVGQRLTTLHSRGKSWCLSGVPMGSANPTHATVASLEQLLTGLQKKFMVNRALAPVKYAYEAIKYIAIL